MKRDTPAHLGDPIAITFTNYDHPGATGFSVAFDDVSLTAETSMPGGGTATPEPGALPLLGARLAALGFAPWRQAKATRSDQAAAPVR